MTNNFLNETYFLLEISGEAGDEESYERIISEIALIGIKNIVFACIWDGFEEKGRVLLEKAQEFCKNLGVTPLPITIGYEKMMYENGAVGEMKRINKVSSPDFSSLISFDEYKMINTPKTENGEDVKKLELTED